MRTFPRLAKIQDDDSVVFSFTAFGFRNHRDEVNAKMVENPAINPERADKGLPFDPERVA